MIRNIIFDMGNVLLTYNPAYIASQLPVHDENRQLLIDNVFGASEWIHLDEGTMEEADFLALVQSRLPEQARKDARIALAEWHRHMVPIDASYQLAKELKAAGYRLYLLSNASKRFHIYENSIPVFGLLDGRFISADYRCLKPQAAIYETFCSHFGLRPEECLFIDDVPANIAGGKAAGIDGVVFDGDVLHLRRELAVRGVSVDSSFDMTPVRTEQDLTVLSQMAEEVWHQHFASILSPEQIDYMVEKFQSYPAMKKQMAEDGYQYYLIREADGAPARPEHASYGGCRGYMGIRVEEDAVFLSKLYLLEPYRGRGLSSRALSFLKCIARDHGCRRIWLTVNRFNDHTIEVYRHWGFEVIREQCADIGSGFVMDDYVMSLEVTE